MSYLIRVLGQNAKPWLNAWLLESSVWVGGQKGAITLADFATDWFQVDGEGGVSVFEVDAEPEIARREAEVAIVAAGALTRQFSKSKEVYALRIHTSDVDRCGITLDDKTPGQTGVKSVDVAHRDMKTEARGAFAELASTILRCQSQGEDRVRLVSPCDLLRQWARYEQMDRSELSDKAWTGLQTKVRDYRKFYNLEK